MSLDKSGIYNEILSQNLRERERCFIRIMFETFSLCFQNTCVYVLECVCVCVQVCVYFSASACLCISLCVFVCIPIYMFVCAYLYIRLSLCLCNCVSLCICIFVSISLCVYVLVVLNNSKNYYSLKILLNAKSTNIYSAFKQMKIF